MPRPPDGSASPANARQFATGLAQKLAVSARLARRVRDEHRVGFVRQFAEMSYLFITRRVGPLLYFEARLWRPDMPLRDKRRFMTGAHYQTRLDRLNPAAYRKFFQHKLAEKALLSLAGIATPEFQGFYHPQGGCDGRGRSLCNLEQLENLLSSCRPDRVCFKMAEGWGGNGFTAAELDRSGSALRLTNLMGEESLDLGTFFEQFLTPYAAEGLLVEEYLQQHDVLADFHPASVNTLRVIAIQKQLDVEILGVALRVGRGRQVVDNAARGGLIAEVDLDTGVISDLRDTAIVPNILDRHPDSGAAVKGVQLPYWTACVSLSKRVVAAYPHLRYAGIDMAIGRDGPVVIEINPVPSFTAYRIFKGHAADLL